MRAASVCMHACRCRYQDFFFTGVDYKIFSSRRGFWSFPLVRVLRRSMFPSVRMSLLSLYGTDVDSDPSMQAEQKKALPFIFDFDFLPLFSLSIFRGPDLLLDFRRKSRMMLMTAEGLNRNRRSARLQELEERKRIEEANRAAAAAAAAPEDGQLPSTARRRGRKRKHVSDVTVNAVNEVPPLRPSLTGHHRSWQPCHECQLDY